MGAPDSKPGSRRIGQRVHAGLQTSLRVRDRPCDGPVDPPSQGSGTKGDRQSRHTRISVPAAEVLRGGRQRLRRPEERLRMMGAW